MASGVYLIMDFDHGVGGVEEHTHRIAKHLTGLGERIVVMAPPSPGAAAFDAACGYPVIRFELPEAVPGGRLLRRCVRLAKATRAFVRTAKAMRADYVMWAAWGPNPGVGIVLCALALRVPFFLFAHGREFTAARGWRLVRRLTVRAATGVLCVSDFIRSRVLLDGARPERVVTVLPGLDVGEADAYRRRAPPGRFPRVAAAFGPGVPAVLSVCRLARGKGVDRMIDAMGKVAAAVPGTRYAVIGAGPEADALQRRAAESAAAGSITFLGAVTGDEKLAFYERCDVFAMPSEDEGFGIVFLEAGGFGKPVVGGRTAPPDGCRAARPDGRPRRSARCAGRGRRGDRTVAGSARSPAPRRERRTARAGGTELAVKRAEGARHRAPIVAADTRRQARRRAVARADSLVAMMSGPMGVIEQSRLPRRGTRAADVRDGGAAPGRPGDGHRADRRCARCAGAPPGAGGW